MEKEILKIAAEILRVDVSLLNLEFSRDNAGVWNSLMHVALVAALEERLDISIPFEEIGSISKLGDFLNYAV